LLPTGETPPPVVVEQFETPVGQQTWPIFILDDEANLLKSLEGHLWRVLDLGFSADGKLLPSGSDDYSAKIWEIDTGEIVHEHNHNWSVTAAQFEFGIAVHNTGGTQKRGEF
jgi:WD40 repeat protein